MTNEPTIYILFEEANHQAAAYDGNQLIGECQYEVAEPNKWLITHTGVRPNYTGQGIARLLVEKVAEEARARNVQIIPICSYAKGIL